MRTKTILNWLTCWRPPPCQTRKQCAATGKENFSNDFKVAKEKKEVDKKQDITLEEVTNDNMKLTPQQKTT